MESASTETRRRMEWREGYDIPEVESGSVAFQLCIDKTASNIRIGPTQSSALAGNMPAPYGNNKRKVCQPSEAKIRSRRAVKLARG